MMGDGFQSQFYIFYDFFLMETRERQKRKTSAVSFIATLASKLFMKQNAQWRSVVSQMELHWLVHPQLLGFLHYVLSDREQQERPSVRMLTDFARKTISWVSSLQKRGHKCGLAKRRGVVSIEIVLLRNTHSKFLVLYHTFIYQSV